MAIFGIGVDVVEIQRFTNIIPETLSKRILSTDELPHFEEAKNKLLFLAKRFSMKEAVAKAFGVGIGKKLSFHNISIFKDANGRPTCTVDKNASHIITGYKNITVHISVSDSSTLVQAYAVVEIID